MTDEVDALRTAICLLTQRIHHIRLAFGEPPSPQGEGNGLRPRNPARRRKQACLFCRPALFHRSRAGHCDFSLHPTRAVCYNIPNEQRKN